MVNMYELKTFDLICAKNIPSMKSPYGTVETFQIPEPIFEYITYLNHWLGKTTKEISDLKDKLHHRNQLCNAREKKIKQLEQRLEWVLTQTNVHGVYKNEQDCIESIRDYICEYEHSNRLLRNKNV